MLFSATATRSYCMTTVLSDPRSKRLHFIGLALDLCGKYFAGIISSKMGESFSVMLTRRKWVWT